MNIKCFFISFSYHYLRFDFNCTLTDLTYSVQCTAFILCIHVYLDNTVNIYCKYTVRFLYIHCTCIYCTYTVYLLCIHCTFLVHTLYMYLLYIHCIFIVHTLCISCKNTVQYCEYCAYTVYLVYC